MKKLFLLSLSLSLAWLLLPAGASAVTFTNLYTFSADAFTSGSNPQATNGDGVGPNGFVVSGNTIYGTAAGGGLYGYGTVFRIDTDGTHFTNLFNFYIGNFDAPSSTYKESTGDMPNPGLLLISNTLYGTTFYGGTFDAGTVFKINTDGSGFAVINSLNFTNGQGPSSGLTLHSNALYGTAAGGGTNASGTVFRVSLADGSLSLICDFTMQEEPYGGVVFDTNGTIYGFGRYGGSSLNGVIYRIGAGGLSYIYVFDGATGSGSYATPVLSGDTLFGVTYQGGTNGSGNVFRINTDGLQYTNLFTFQGQGGANTSGAYPYDAAALVLSDGILYGTASVSGSGGQGTVFQLNTDGSGFTVLHSFQYTDGGQPASLVLSAGTLYGVTSAGFQGISLGDGGIFAIVLQPVLNIRPAVKQQILFWNNSSYSLYSGPTITNIVNKVIGASSPYTNTISASQMFFELRSN